MQGFAQPSLEEVRDNSAFEALLWASSRPGTIRSLPVPGESSIVTALLDRECCVHSADPLLLPNIARTGAEIAEVEAADHVFLGQLTALDVIEQLGIGSDLYPDGGATVVLRAAFGEGDAVCLSGPGVDGKTNIRLGNLPEGFWSQRSLRIRYPMGFDLFFVDGDKVIGLPRSTHVEVI